MNLVIYQNGNIILIGNINKEDSIKDHIKRNNMVIYNFVRTEIEDYAVIEHDIRVY